MRPADSPTVRGLFFSFEGIDGSGKSTQARMLAVALEAAGERVVAVREPGGTTLGEKVRAVLLDPTSEIVPRAELLLFAAARAQLVDTVITPSLLSGNHVIADRYVDSTTAYQGAGRGLGTGEALDGIQVFATDRRMPDRTYLISLPIAIAARRLSLRAVDRMEQPDDDFRERVSDAYDRLSTENLDRVVVLDGLAPARDLHQVILDDALTSLAVSRRRDQSS